MLIAIYIYDCNMSCTYCDEKEHIIKHERLSIGEIAYIFKKINAYAQKSNAINHLEFIWFGGEPLLLGVGFFKKVIRLQKKIFGKNLSWKNGMQTNLTLLTNKYIAFFKRNHKHFNIGVSFDFYGEERVFKNRTLSNKLVHKNIMKLFNKKIPFVIICVLTKTNIRHIDKIYSFIKDHPIYVRFLFAKKLNFPKATKDKIYLSENEYLKALSWLFKKWWEDKSSLGVVDNAMHIIMKILGNEERSTCTYQKCCQTWFLTIIPGGDVFPGCIKTISYGNIFSDSLEDILSSPFRKRLLARPRIIHSKLCKNCDVLKYCEGGCFVMPFLTKRQLYVKDPLCKTNYTLIHQIKDYLEKDGFINKKGKPSKKAIEVFKL